MSPRALLARPAVRRLLLLGAVVAILGTLGVAALTSARSAQRDLVAAREDLEDGLAAVTAGEVDAAASAFGDADRSAAQAVSALRSPQVRIIGFIPKVGSTVRSATAVAEAASLVAEAGSGLLDEVAALPGGFDALIPREQQIPTELAGLADGLERARGLLVLATEILESAPEDTVVNQVDQARAALAAELEAARPRVEQLAAVARAVPAFLGAEGPRRYLLGAQNPAELRGTGGLIGAFSILEIADGRLSLDGFTSIGELPRDLPAPVVQSPDYLERYGTAIDDGAGRWSNLNFTPDVPSASEALLSSYRAANGEELDGVVLVDPFALQALMTVTGPTEVPGIGEVTAETVVDFVANQAPVYFDDSGERKETLGDVAIEVLERFLSEGHDPVAQARAVAQAAGGGHVLLYSADPEVQVHLEQAGLAGPLAPADPGYLGVFGSSVSGTKLDYYVNRRVFYEVFLNPDGSGTAVVEVTLSSDAPTSGLPTYTIGPHPDLELQAGENLTALSVFCGPCELMSTTRTREYLTVSGEEEGGHNVLETWEPLPAGEVTRTRHVVRIPGAWSRAGKEGTAEVMFQDQPTIRPTELSVVVHPPRGWTLAPAGTAMSLRDDGAADWTGEPAPLQRFPVTLTADPAAIQDVRP